MDLEGSLTPPFKGHLLGPINSQLWVCGQARGTSYVSSCGKSLKDNQKAVGYPIQPQAAVAPQTHLAMLVVTVAWCSQLSKIVGNSTVPPRSLHSTLWYHENQPAESQYQLDLFMCCDLSATNTEY